MGVMMYRASPSEGVSASGQNGADKQACVIRTIYLLTLNRLCSIGAENNIKNNCT